MNKARTERGFRIFGLGTARTGHWRVIESSLALEGPHCRIYGKDEVGDDAHLHLSVPEAGELAEALLTFICEAAIGELTEPMDNFYGEEDGT